MRVVVCLQFHEHLALACVTNDLYFRISGRPFDLLLSLAFISSRSSGSLRERYVGEGLDKRGTWPGSWATPLAKGNQVRVPRG